MSLKLNGQRLGWALYLIGVMVALCVVIKILRQDLQPVLAPIAHVEKPPVHAIKSKLGACEQCGKSLRKVHGRYGEFVGCSGYPECRYIQRPKASFCCPSCAASIERRTWSGGVLWGCSRYPDCRYAIFSDIEDAECPRCKKSPYMIKKIDEQGVITVMCPRDDCAQSV